MANNFWLIWAGIVLTEYYFLEGLLMTILNVLVVGEVNTGKSTFIDIHTNDDGEYSLARYLTRAYSLYTTCCVEALWLDSGHWLTTFMIQLLSRINSNCTGTYNDMSISNVNDHEYKVKYFEFDDKEDKTKQYKDKDLILLCFAVNNVPSYNKLDEVYVKEVC